MSIKQRLLYLSCESTHPQSPTVSAAFYEPIEGSVTEIDPTMKELAYNSVHEAVIDGWRIVHFPDQRGSEDMDIIGYQFILEKMEQFDD
tara:strand:+ start:675 stop:941 length:267 start_codon:yes stop_codon:yes gene_type:complete